MIFWPFIALYIIFVGREVNRYRFCSITCTAVKYLKKHLSEFCFDIVQIMWSIANEPVSFLPSADSYFAEIASHTRALDSSRPITIAQLGLQKQISTVINGIPQKQDTR